MATQTSVLGLSKPAGNENALVSVLNSDMDLIDAEAGKVRGNIAATYSASSSYAIGDLCIYNGILYKCNTAIGSGGETWNASHWTQITIDGELTNAKVLRTRATFTVTTGNAVLHFPGSGNANLGSADKDIRSFIPNGATLVAIIPGQSSRDYGQDYAYSLLSDLNSYSVRIVGSPNKEYSCVCDILYRLY